MSFQQKPDGFGSNLFGGFGGFGGFSNGGTHEGENQGKHPFDENSLKNAFRKQKETFQGKKKGLWIALLVLFLLIVLSGSILNFVMELFMISEVGNGFSQVFWKNVFYRLAVSGSGFVLVFLVTVLNAFLLRKLAFIKHLNVKFAEKKWPYVLAAVLFSAIFGGILGENAYGELLQALNATSFGTTDPLFGRDIGYYIFVRPLFLNLTASVKGIFLLQTLVVTAVYLLVFFTAGIKNVKTMITTQRGALSHVLANVLLYYLTMVLSYRLTAENLMYGSFGGNGSITGAGYIESNIWLTYYRFAPYLILTASVLAVVFLWRKRYKFALISVAAVPVVYALVLGVSLFTQQFVVAPDERNCQTPYIQHNMDATKKAFGLTDIREVQFDFNKPLTDDVVTENKEELLNTRIIDFNASLTAYNQLQYFRKYYTFNDIDVVPYEIDGTTTGVFLSARELNQENLEDSARSYTNEKFRYTHGFGIAASPFNKTTADGQPQFVVKDIPAASEQGMPNLTQPRIYYGELTDDYVIVGSDNKELDYSEGYTDIEYTYEGESGIQLSFFKKLLFSVYYKDYKMFFSGNVDENSRILLNRNVLDRVKMIAPFFQYESDPCIVLDDNGEIKWVVDGFTVSDQYPYAQKFDGVNYIRNSVKAIVDAYSGDVTFYVIDESDPIVQTYRKIYPSLFSNEPIPDSIKNHLTVPEGLFKLQSQVYQRYHLEDAGQFYDQSDVWRVSTEKYHNNEVVVEPYFNMFTIDGEQEPELVLTLPYVLGDKYNMVGVFMLRSSPEHYGELVLYRIPKSATVYGPMQIENKIDNDPDISREMTLWGQGGSTVIRGNLLVIPFENSIFYVEPVYITSQNNASLPEIKRIIVAYKDEVAMAPTLEEALSQVLKTSDGLSAEQLTEDAEAEKHEPSEQQPVTRNPGAEEAEEKIKKALEAYEAFKSSSAQNDWSKMGQDLSALDQAMNALK